MSIELTRTASTTETRLGPGDFALFRYRDEEGNYSEREVLVTAYDEKTNLVHALDLDEFTDANLFQVGQELARFASRREDYQDSFDEDGSVTVDIQDFQMEEWYDRLYESDRFEDNPYRTFREDRIRNLYKAEAAIVA
jgi:hypothetical protein